MAFVINTRATQFIGKAFDTRPITPIFFPRFPSLCRPKTNNYPGEPFQILKAVPVDMFPQTDHCEVVLLLQRGNALEVSLAATQADPVVDADKAPVASAPADSAPADSAPAASTQAATSLGPASEPTANVTEESTLTPAQVETDGPDDVQM